MSDTKRPIKIALYGMDERAHKTMVMYLKGPCNNIAISVSEAEAEIDLIDVDYFKAKELLENRKLKCPDRPLILISLVTMSIEDTIYVKKPIESVELMAAIERATTQIFKKETDSEGASEDGTVSNIKVDLEVSKETDSEEAKKTSKHSTAKDLTEHNYSTYMGYVESIDFSDKKQAVNATYNSKEFFLGYVQSAIKSCKKKGRILQLNSGWKPLLIFPQSNEVWLDSDDKQLRAFAGIAIKKNASKGMTLTPLDQSEINIKEKMDCFYDSDFFLWKLAVWTSKGRFPDVIDINKPVYLTQWPNFTRLVVTPHAMRISALLVMGPRTAMDVAESLNIKPQHVFVFISAANALGLLSQAKRQNDELIASRSIERSESKSKGLLGRILSRLRGKD